MAGKSATKEGSSANGGPKSSNVQSSNGRSSNGYQDTRSDNRVIKDGGFDNLHHMMRSYGLPTHEPKAYDEARDIVQAFRDADASQARESDSPASTVSHGDDGLEEGSGGPSTDSEDNGEGSVDDQSEDDEDGAASGHDEGGNDGDEDADDDGDDDEDYDEDEDYDDDGYYDDDDDDNY